LGLLPDFDPNDPVVYLVLENGRTPGGDGSIKCIETTVELSVAPPVVPKLPPVITPPVITPPSFAEPLCGWVNFIFGVSFSGTVCSAICMIDGVPFGAIVGPNSGNITPVFVSFAACALTIGVHTICVTVIPCDTSVAAVTNCWTFNVNHNCC
jgi:hypothetical protein